MADERAGTVGGGQLVELGTVVSKRHMCRSFRDEPVSADVLERALRLATRAPSAGKAQGWAFVVLEGADTMGFWHHAADSSWLEHPSHPGLLKAPVVVVPLASKELYMKRYSEPDKAARRAVDAWQVPYWLVDAAFATMVFLLGLTQEGLGALFFSLHKPAGPLLSHLGVPDGWEPIGAVAVGWPSPDDKPATSAKRRRRSTAEVVHWGRW
ncbi:MAG: nitroreductase family protein [Acidimicrobiales bacterium]